MIIAFFLFLLFCLTVWYYPKWQFQGVPKKYGIYTIIIKCLVGYAFAYVYIYNYPKNIIPSDAIRFLHDADLLNQIYQQSPSTYFRLLFGLPIENIHEIELIQKTKVWDSGGLTLINDFRNVTRFHSILNFISHRHSVHILVICIISYVGFLQLYNSIISKIKVSRKITFWLLLCIPSVLFWSSGILKEPFIFLGISLLIRILFKTESIQNKILPSFICLIVFLCFKPYVFLCILPALLFGLLNKGLNYQFKYSVSVLFFAGILIYGLIGYHSIQKMVRFISAKQLDFINTGKGGLHLLRISDNTLYHIPDQEVNHFKLNTKGTYILQTECVGEQYSTEYYFKHTKLQPSDSNFRFITNEPGAHSYFDITPIQNSSIRLIQTIPEALINGLFRPYTIELKSKFSPIAWVENFFIYSILFISFIYRRKLNKKEINIIFSLLIFIFCLTILIGWTTPVTGAIFRYRFPIQLAFILISLIIFDPQRIKFKLK